MATSFFLSANMTSSVVTLACRRGCVQRTKQTVSLRTEGRMGKPNKPAVFKFRFKRSRPFPRKLPNVHALLGRKNHRITRFATERLCILRDVLQGLVGTRETERMRINLSSQLDEIRSLDFAPESRPLNKKVPLKLNGF